MRDIVIVLIVAIAASVAGFSLWRRRKNAASLADGVAEAEAEDDSIVLDERMKDALATLKKSAKGGSTYLYDLPWYVIIGPPGAGKTTALVNSGLQVPARRRRDAGRRSPASAARATATGGSPRRRC